MLIALLLSVLVPGLPISTSSWAAPRPWCEDLRELMRDADWMEMIRESLLGRDCSDRFELTDFESANVFAYTDDGSHDYNEALREGGTKLSGMAPCIDGLNSAIHKMPIVTGKVWRGVTFPAQVNKEHQVGAVVTYKAFTSASMIELGNYKGTHRLWIQSKTGRDISPCADYNEREVIFAPGTRFLVRGRLGNSIWLEEVAE